MDELEEVTQLRRTLDANDYTIDRYKTLMQEKAAIFKAPQMKRGRTKGKRGGGSHWDEYAVQMVCELLVFGVPPTVIPGTIVTMNESLLRSSLKKVPLASFA